MKLIKASNYIGNCGAASPVPGQSSSCSCCQPWMGGEQTLQKLICCSSRFELLGKRILAASSPAAELLPPHPAPCLLQREGGIFGERHLCVFPDSAKSREKGFEFLPSSSARAAARITHLNLPCPAGIPAAPFLCWVPFDS